MTNYILRLSLVRSHLARLAVLLLILFLAAFAAGYNSKSKQSLQNRAVEIASEEESNSDNATQLADNPVIQTIYVMFGIAQEVIDNHCDNDPKRPETKIDPATNRCLLVERLAQRDLEAANKYFAGTGKTFILSGFDQPWKQDKYFDPDNPELWHTEKNLGCDKATGGQLLPPKICNTKYATGI